MRTFAPPRRRRRRSAGLTILGVLAIIGLVAAVFLLEAFVVMVVWGAVGTTFFETGKFRTIGFGTACVVALALGVVGGFFKSSSR